VEEYNSFLAVDLANALDGELTRLQVNGLYQKVKGEGSIKECLSLAKSLSALSNGQIQALGRLVIKRSKCTSSIETAIAFGCTFELNNDTLKALIERGVKRISHWHNKKRLKSVKGLSEGQLERIESEIEV
jgi:hypothetical protein